MKRIKLKFYRILEYSVDAYCEVSIPYLFIIDIGILNEKGGCLWIELMCSIVTRTRMIIFI